MGLKHVGLKEEKHVGLKEEKHVGLKEKKHVGLKEKKHVGWVRLLSTCECSQPVPQVCTI